MKDEGETDNCEMMAETAKLQEEGKQKISCRHETQSYSMAVTPQTVQVEKPHRHSHIESDGEIEGKTTDVVPNGRSSSKAFLLDRAAASDICSNVTARKAETDDTRRSRVDDGKFGRRTSIQGTGDRKTYATGGRVG